MRSTSTLLPPAPSAAAAAAALPSSSSYCHVEDRRVIPHRVVHHWDFSTHRVCKDAGRFLDATRFLPVFDLPEVSPSLFADLQVGLSGFAVRFCRVVVLCRVSGVPGPRGDRQTDLSPPGLADGTALRSVCVLQDLGLVFGAVISPRTGLTFRVPSAKFERSW